MVWAEVMGRLCGGILGMGLLDAVACKLRAYYDWHFHA